MKIWGGGGGRGGAGFARGSALPWEEKMVVEEPCLWENAPCCNLFFYLLVTATSVFISCNKSASNNARFEISVGAFYWQN